MATSPLELHEPVVQARERLALATGLALLAAGVALVIGVLPAEYGIDPTGIGRRLGLTAMNDVQRSLETFQQGRAADVKGAATITPQERAYQQEQIQLEIAPGEFVEYKYRLDKGQSLLYSWKATDRVNYELHAEPDGAPRGYAESYEKRSAMDGASGTLVAPFSGIHGWYWENPTNHAVTVTLSAAGFYRMSYEFRKGVEAKPKMFP